MLFATQCASARACVAASSPNMDWDAYDAAVAATKDRKASAAHPRSKGAAPGTSSRILGRVNGGALGTRPAARPPSTTRPPAKPAKPARPADSDPVANEEGVLTLDLLREAAGAAGAGPSDAVELDLHNRGITTLARGALSRCGATLADLDLSFNAVSVVEGLEPLVALRHLRVYDNRVTDLRGLRAVGATLRSLRAQNNAFASLEGVETLRALTLLRVDGNPLGTHQGTRLVGRCTALTRLDISRCGLTKLEGFATLHRLSTLAAAGNRLRSLEPLAKCVSLTELDVADNRLSDDALRHLAPLRRLDALVLDGNPIRDPSKMPTLPELVELSLARCGFASLGPRGALAAAAPSLETLDASENTVRDVTTDVGAALEGNERLSEIRLARNPCAGDAEPRREEESSDATTLRYRRAVVAAIPSVLYVDDIAVGDAERVVDVAPEEAIRRRDVAARLGAMGVRGRPRERAQGDWPDGEDGARPRTPASFGFLGVRVDDEDDDADAHVEEDEDEDDEWEETEAKATRATRATKAGIERATNARATKAGIERATNARANARPRSAVVAAEASRRFPGFVEDAATTTARFAARVEAYKTEMTATLARVRDGSRVGSARGGGETQGGRFVSRGCRAPSRRRASPPNPRWRRSHRARGWTVTNRKCEPRRKPRDEPGTETRSRGWKTGTTIRARGRRRSSRRRARGRAPRSISSRARSPGSGRVVARVEAHDGAAAAEHRRRARVAAAMAAAEAAAADSDEDRDDRDDSLCRPTPTRPVDRPDLHLREEEHENEKGTERDAGTSGEHRARVETLRGASATAPTKTKTASSSAARPTMRRARAGSTSAVLVAARRAPGAGASVRGAPRGVGARRST